MHRIAGLLAAPALARAQGFPDRPVRLVVPYPPGGNVDVDLVDKHSWGVLIDRLNADDAAVRAVVLEFHPARDPGEDRVVLPDAGHLPNLERPEAFLAALAAFSLSTVACVSETEAEEAIEVEEARLADQLRAA